MTNNKFWVRCRQYREIKPGAWKVQDVEVFYGEDKIGEYVRYYPSYLPFAPFKMLNGKMYALYSADYTGTRVMTLPDCVDIGGEEINSGGFCPVELWVPSYSIGTLSYGKHSSSMAVFTDELDRPDVYSMPFGFVTGCVWGDDSFWKLEAFDLREADKGILKRFQLLGYVDMPNTYDGQSMSSFISIDPLFLEDEDCWVDVTINVSFNMNDHIPPSMSAGAKEKST